MSKRDLHMWRRWPSLLPHIVCFFFFTCLVSPPIYMWACVCPHVLYYLSACPSLLLLHVQSHLHVLSLCTCRKITLINILAVTVLFVLCLDSKNCVHVAIYERNIYLTEKMNKIMVPNKRWLPLRLHQNSSQIGLPPDPLASHTFLKHIFPPKKIQILL